MRVVLQRVKTAKVEVQEENVGAIETGILLFIGMGKEDTEAIVEKVANKILSLRIFSDNEGKMNNELDPKKDKILAISQFTLYANVKKGKRPSFTDSMEPREADRLYEYFCTYCKTQGYQVEKGIFGADMDVTLVNDGPVTIIIDSKEL